MTNKNEYEFTSCWFSRHPVLPVLFLCFIGVSAGCGGGNDPVELFQNGEYAASFRIFSERAAAGDIHASNYLGTHYYLGAGVERDFARAAELYEVAALAEDPDAQRNLGIMYLRGLGVKKDYHKAYGWLYQAHASGNKGAKKYLEMMGDNVTPNASGIARKHVRRQIVAARVAAKLEAEKPADK